MHFSIPSLLLSMCMAVGVTYSNVLQKAASTVFIGSWILEMQSQQAIYGSMSKNVGASMHSKPQEKQKMPMRLAQPLCKAFLRQELSNHLLNERAKARFHTLTGSTQKQKRDWKLFDGCQKVSDHLKLSRTVGFSVS
jgi:coenzyme F420-reducing hydrogenase alpha subunit